MNLKDSKPNVVSQLHRIIKLEHSAYRNMPIAYNLSNLYFFTVTPKGEGKTHEDYLETFKEAIFNVKPLNFAYYVKESENTDHLHGVISIKVPNYKFSKLKNDLFIFRASSVNSLYACTRYMNKHNPTCLYKLQVIKFYTRIAYDVHERPKGVGDLKYKKVFKEIKLSPYIL